MIITINKGCDWIRSHFNREKVNKFSIVIIMIYYYVGLLSYITVPIKPVYRLFISGSTVSVVVRALMAAMICLYCLLVVIVNKEKVQWKWAVVFVYVLLFTLISAVISPQTYNYVYIENLYKVVHWVQSSTGFNRLFTMYLSSISDFALAFCFLFILPLVLNNKKQLIILTLPLVFICLLECGYSLITERGEYYKLFNFIDPQYAGYNINIGASFGNKQDWGSFAALSFVASLFSLFLIGLRGWKRYVLKTGLVISSLVIFAFSVMSLCKTAIFSEVLAIIILLVYLGYRLFKKHRKLFVLYAIIVFLSLIVVVLFYAVPILHSSSIFKKIYDFTYKFIIERLTPATIMGRSSIWLRFVNNLRTYNLFFGLSKAGVSTYSQVVTIEGQSAIHNGFAYYFGSYGILGFAIYLILLGVVFKRLFKLFNFDNLLFTMSFISLTTAIIFSLAESEVFIVSGSIPIFLFNIIVCCFPKGYVDSKRKEVLL